MEEGKQRESVSPENPPSNQTNPSLRGEKILQPSLSLMQEIQNTGEKKVQYPQTSIVEQNPQYSSVPSIAAAPIVDNPEKLHFGIYIIVGLLFLGFILGFFNNNSNIIYTLLLFLNVVLGVGILFKKEVARKVLVFFSALLIVLEIIAVSGLFLVQNAAQQKANNAQSALNKIANNQTLSETQSNQINAYKAQISAQQETLNKTYTVAYIEDALVIFANIVLVIYLTRPSIKSIFN